MNANTEYPIYPKTYDLIVWLMQTTVAFPKSQRFVMAQRVQDTVVDFYDLLIAARKVDPQQRKQLLLRADVKLETLRLHLRLCRDLRLLSPEQYQHGARLVNEVGKLLGSWRGGKPSGSQA